MSAYVLAAIGAMYLWVAVGHVLAGRYGMALAFFSYALGNLGFILDLRKI